ncbi:MAG: FAD-binding protein [Candidatus Scalindua sp.]
MDNYEVTTLDKNIDLSNIPYRDVVITGAGEAGMAAGLTTAHRGLTMLVIEAKDSPGGQPQFLYAEKRIIDIPGFPMGLQAPTLGQGLSSGPGFSGTVPL